MSCFKRFQDFYRKKEIKKVSDSEISKPAGRKDISCDRTEYSANILSMKSKMITTSRATQTYSSTVIDEGKKREAEPEADSGGGETAVVMREKRTGGRCRPFSWKRLRDQLK